MVMKIFLVAALVMALGSVSGQRCISRRQKKEYRELDKITRCKKPQPSLVQLPVPEGFDSVTPSVVTLHQCAGLSCSAFHERCLPMPGQTVDHTYAVYARSRNGVQSVCAHVTVQEHLGCECRCDERTCPSNRVFNTETCDCECNPHLERDCATRRDVQGEEVMWSSKFCSCECDRVEPCDSMTVWDPNQCQCAAVF